jgi:hypothetical protein
MGTSASGSTAGEPTDMMHQAYCCPSPQHPRAILKEACARSTCTTTWCREEEEEDQHEHPTLESGTLYDFGSE